MKKPWVHFKLKVVITGNSDEEGNVQPVGAVSLKGWGQKTIRYRFLSFQRSR